MRLLSFYPVVLVNSKLDYWSVALVHLSVLTKEWKTFVWCLVIFLYTQRCHGIKKHQKEKFNFQLPFMTHEYLCLNSRSFIVKTHDNCFLVDHQKSHKPETVLVEEMRPNGFTVFWSERSYRKKTETMFLALKRNGDPKNALKTSLRHKSVQFTVMFCSSKRQHMTLHGNSPAC